MGPHPHALLRASRDGLTALPPPRMSQARRQPTVTAWGPTPMRFYALRATALRPCRRRVESYFERRGRLNNRLTTGFAQDRISLAGHSRGSLSMKRAVSGLFLVLPVITVCLSAQRMLPAAPDLILTNGKIISVDDENRVFEAVAIRGDRFLAIGTNAQVLALKGGGTRTVDLRGHAVIPGLMDNHNHQYHVALLQRGVDVRGVPSLAEMLDRLRRAAGAAPGTATVFTSDGWEPDEFPEKRGPTRQD